MLSEEELLQGLLGFYISLSCLTYSSLETFSCMIMHPYILQALLKKSLMN